MRLTFALALLLFLSSGQVVWAQGFMVQDISPSSHALHEEVQASITATFSMPIDPSSVTPDRFMAFGRWSGVMTGTFAFEALNTQVRFVPDRPFFAGERVMVSIARTVKSADGTPLNHGYTWHYNIRTLPASLDLEEIAQIEVRDNKKESHIQSYGAYAGDFNQDGFSDVAVPNENTNDIRVFLNDQQGLYNSYILNPIPGGSRPSPSDGADFNHDGHMDLVVGNSTNDKVSVFKGRGDGTFVQPTNTSADEGVRGVAVLDLDGDGYADIATANRMGEESGTISLLRNNGAGNFMLLETLNTVSFQETAIEAADANGDGILDLFVGALGSQEMIIMKGDGEGGVSLHSRTPAGGRVWMIATGDINADGFVDVVSANSSNNNVGVMFGDGTGSLSNAVTYPTGAFTLAVDLGDLDGDGDLDLVTSNFQGADWTLYENAGNGTFINRRNIPAPFEGAGSCAILHDRDNDGTLDMTGIDELNDLLILFRNPATDTATEMQPLQPILSATAYPNPFTDEITLSFALPLPGRVHLLLYDLLGRTVYQQRWSQLDRGDHAVDWDGRNAEGQQVAMGVYFYRFETQYGITSGQFVRHR